MPAKSFWNEIWTWIISATVYGSNSTESNSLVLLVLQLYFLISIFKWLGRKNKELKYCGIIYKNVQ